MYLHRSPARRLRKQLQSSSISVDSLQAAVLAPRQPLAVSSAALRRGVTASAQTGLTGTWKIDKVGSNADAVSTLAWHGHARPKRHCHVSWTALDPLAGRILQRCSVSKYVRLQKSE